MEAKESTGSAAPAERHAGWNELFFDLVVVAGAGQLAHLLHGGPHLADSSSTTRAGRMRRRPGCGGRGIRRRTRLT
ncbi:hypothetical protein PV749_15060 [Streptomyces sp. ID03-2B]|uniref:Uncharacterized protein n=1 Tax=Streptomyces caviscabies TaxID=90079 RepID=A0ABW2MB91_9ACTN|nr:hypothetical protein [Streptomyces sp. ATCC51928]MDX3592435.1 hypothetical protein [Streptomyces sp. ID03-2B]MDX5522861.1 hypothetical protein [Streptomyces sp. DE06-01C]